MNIRKKYILTGIGAITGVIGGYMYYYYIGCASGSCAITSNPINSSLYGALMGGLLFSMFQDKEIKNDTNLDERK